MLGDPLEKKIKTEDEKFIKILGKMKINFSGAPAS